MSLPSFSIHVLHSRWVYTRQHFRVIEEAKECFKRVVKFYWYPTVLNSLYLRIWNSKKNTPNIKQGIVKILLEILNKQYRRSSTYSSLQKMQWSVYTQKEKLDLEKKNIQKCFVHVNLTKKNIWRYKNRIWGEYMRKKIKLRSKTSAFTFSVSAILNFIAVDTHRHILSFRLTIPFVHRK